MRYFLTALLCSALLGIVACTENKISAPVEQSPASFSNLQEAVTFIAACLDQDDFEKLSGACVGGRRPAVYLAQHRSVFDTLKAAHENTPLQELYADRTFPEDTNTLKLGGHMAELGCLHIDFVKRDGHWFLADIWQCK